MRRVALGIVSGGLLVLCLALFSATSHSTSAPASPERSEPGVQVGEVKFPTSCSASAQPMMETGVALLHSFQYEEADQTFSRAAKEDPKCAMAHWGKAMSRYEQLWDFPKGKTLKAGLDDVRRAQKIGVSNERERGYIAAAFAFYGADSKVKDADRIKQYSASLAQLHNKFPDDVDAGAFYALSLVALAEDEQDAITNRKNAIAILQLLCRVAPNNPGPAHYLIHATDNPEFASLGLDAARSYATIAPDSSHALHMPSHIFVRLGLWEESIRSNIAASASAARATEEHRATPHYQFHAMDFLNYSYLQSGDESKARQVIEQMDKVPGASAEDIADHKGYMTA